MPNETSTPTCPGCHFGCTLDDYQCGRGGKFHEKWQAGEEIPVRRPPWERKGGRPEGRNGNGEGGEAGHGGGPSREAVPHAEGEAGKHRPPAPFAKMPAGARLVMLVSMASRMLSDRDDEARDARIAECILRQDGSATNRIITERTRLDDAAIDGQVAAMEQRGIVVSRTLEDGRVFHELTDEGREQAKKWMDEHWDADAAFFSALSDDEAEQLEALLAKALDPHMRRRPR